MIDSQHHVELNGVKYRLYESGDGSHYVHAQEPLRPPNSVVVQGTSRQDLFQLRPDILLWSLTDWSGGEGQLKYDPSASNRHLRLENVRCFDMPGSLRPGPAVVRSQDSTGAADFVADVSVVPCGTAENDLIAVSGTTSNYHVWDHVNKKWGAATAPTGTAPSNPPSFDGLAWDGQRLYYLDGTTGDVFSWTTARVSTKMNGAGNTITNPGSLRELGDYIYAFDILNGVYEMPKSASGAGTWTSLFTRTYFMQSLESDINGARFMMTTSENRVYVMASSSAAVTEVYEITPTSAAGPGSGTILARIPGLVGTSLWFAGGLLYLTGWDSFGDKKNRVLMFIDPDDGSYGVVDLLRPTYVEDVAAWARAGQFDGTLGSYMFALFGTARNPSIMELRLASGGLAQFGQGDVGTAVMHGVVQWYGDFFLVEYDTISTSLTWFADKDTYTPGTSYFISPSHDFGLSADKILSSISFTCQPLPADWEIEVYYSLDDGAWTAAGVYSTTNGVGTAYQITTDTATKKFRSLALKVEFDYTGGSAAPTTGPVLTNVEVRSQVAQPQNVWRLKLDLMDDLGGSQQSLSGSQKITNITTAGASGSAIAFKDGYQSPMKKGGGQFVEYDVLVDSYQIVLDRPGEGYVEVTLREVA